jgi:predicted lactoylglutathione lyase
VFGTGDSEPFFAVSAGQPSFWSTTNTPASSPMHIAFRALSREAVDRFHAVGLECGATSNGAPGVRRRDRYQAFLIDLDGNNIEASTTAR